MEEWKEYRLGDIIAIKSGFAYKGDMIGHGENILLGMGCVSFKERFLLSGARAYAGDCADRYCANSGDIVLATRQQSDNLPILGMPAIIPHKLSEKRIIIGANLYRVDNESDFSNEYIYWLLKTPMYVNHIRSCQSGTTVRMITKANIEDFRFKAPGRKERDRISSFFKTLDDKIEVNRRINDNLEQQAQALFKSWFVDFEPFKDGEFKETEQGMIPKGWKASSLEDITVQKSERVGDRDDVKVLSPVTTGELMLSEEYFTKQVFSESIAKYKVVEIGDFAYNPARVNIGSLGRNNYDFDGCVSPVYVVLSCKDGYAYLFDLYRKTEKFKTEVNLRAIGGVRQSLNYKDFAFIQCIVPPYRVVEEFNAMYEHLLVMQKHTQEESERLASLRDTLLPRLMSGELKVNEIEKVI